VNSEWVVDVVQRLPQALLSRGWGWLARRRSPRPFVEAFKRVFVQVNGIDMSEAADGIGHYQTLEDLFVRTLRAGARRVDPDPTVVVSPVDGTVGQCGVVEDGTLLQAKGRSYSLARLLDDEEEAERYDGGPYATFYLAPKDYHRIHSPVAGSIAAAQIVPGALMPVFVAAVEKVDELFARNERLISYVDTEDAGRVAVIKVGATLVGRISVTYDRDVHTNRPGQSARRLSYDPPKPMPKGGELGAFELGSTVIVVGEAGKIELDVASGETVRMGERIGSIGARAPKKASKKKSAGRRATARGSSARRN
jgi:phosphatidylserine decarboxylase